MNFKSIILVLPLIFIFTACNKVSITNSDITVCENRFGTNELAESVQSTQFSNDIYTTHIDFTTIKSSEYIDDERRDMLLSLVEDKASNIPSELYEDIELYENGTYSYSQGWISDFYMDYDGDGCSESFIVKCIGNHPQRTYKELWFTDGESSLLLTSNVGNNNVKAVTMGKQPLIVYQPAVSMGAPANECLCYTVVNGFPIRCSYLGNDKFILFGNDVKAVLYDEIKGTNNWIEVTWEDGKVVPISNS